MSFLNWLGLSASPQPKRQQRRTVLSLEPLEDRATPDVALAAMMHDPAMSHAVREAAHDMVHDARVLAHETHHLALLEQRLTVEQQQGLPTDRTLHRIAHEVADITQTLGTLQTDALTVLQDMPDPPPHGGVNFDLPPNVPPIDFSLLGGIGGGGGPTFQPPPTTEGGGGGGIGGGQTGSGQVIVITW